MRKGHTKAGLRKILSIYNIRSQCEKSPAVIPLHYVYRDPRVEN